MSEDFEKVTRNKSQLLNVAFGQLLEYVKDGKCPGDFANLVGLSHWFSAGLLEGSLRAFEHLKEKHSEQLK